MNTSVIIGDIQKAVAKECRYWKDASKENIEIITKSYLDQLKRDDCTVMPHKQTVDSNATRVNFFIDHED